MLFHQVFMWAGQTQAYEK